MATPLHSCMPPDRKDLGFEMPGKIRDHEGRPIARASVRRCHVRVIPDTQSCAGIGR